MKNAKRQLMRYKNKCRQHVLRIHQHSAESECVTQMIDSEAEQMLQLQAGLKLGGVTAPQGNSISQGNPSW